MGAYIRSTQDVQILDLVSEGEIEGLVDGLQSVYLNGIPVMSPAGTLNYEEVVVQHRYGTPTQTAMPILKGVEAEFTIGAEVKYGTPIQATISDDTVSSARVTISMNGLYGEGKKGLAYKTLRYRIEVDDGSGVYKQASRKGYKTYSDIAVSNNNTNSITVSTSSVAGDTQGLDVYFAWLTPASTQSVTMNTQTSEYNVWDGTSAVSTDSYNILDGIPPDYLLEYKDVSSGTWLTYSSGTFPDLPTDGSLTDNAYVIHVNDSALPPSDYDFRFTLSGGSGIGFVGGSQDLANKVGTWNVVGRKRYKIIHRTGISSFYSNTALITEGSAYLDADISRYVGSGGDITLRLASQLPADLSYEIALPGRVGASRVIRVTKLDEDVISKGSNSISFKGYTEIVDERLRYPNSAYFYVRADAEQFGGKIPSRAYELDLIKIKIPTNYNPHTRITTGLWDGTFKVAWSNNPAWVFYDLATNSRYGLGTYITEAQIDKWSLYTIAQYCDEPVDSGFGPTEPRFTTNIFLQTREEAYTVLQNLASVFRGLTYWNAGQLVSIQDAPKNPVALFSRSNVIDGVFSYSGSSRKDRHSVALVTWNDPEDLYKAKVEYVEDTDSIQLYGVRQLEVVATGCTSRGQAHRLGKWMLYSEKLETEVVNFKFGLDNSGVVPGDIIQVLDSSRAGVRYSGRLKSVNSTSVVLDASVDFIAGISYTLIVTLPKGAESTLPDGTTSTSALSELQEISFSVPTNITSDTITPGGTIFTTLPIVNGIWGISEENVVPQEFKVIGVTQLDSSTFELTALEHNNGKFASVEDGLDIPLNSTSILSGNPSVVSTHQVTESLAISVDGKVRTDIELGWDGASNAHFYSVEYRYTYLDEDLELVESAWIVAHNRVASQSITIQDVVDSADYYFKVYSITDLGGTSVPYETTVGYTVLGKTAPPEDVQNFTSTTSRLSISLSWDEVTDLDRSHYEIRSGLDWATGTVVTTELKATEFSIARDGLVAFDYMIKAIDTSGNYSSNSTHTGFSLTTPANITGFSITQNIQDTTLSWDAIDNTEVLLVGYEIRKGASWASGEVIVSTHASTNLTLPLEVDLGTSYYTIKAIDVFGVYSADAAVASYEVTAPTAVTGLSIERRRTDMLISWVAIAGLVYEVRKGNTWSSAESIITNFSGSNIVVDESTAGTYTYFIKAINNVGNASVEAVANITLNAPTAITNFVIVQSGDRLEFAWDESPLSDYIVEYEIRLGPVWASSSLVGKTSATYYTIRNAYNTTTETYQIKAIASPGIYSNIPTSYSDTDYIASPAEGNLVFTQTEEPAWAGNRINYSIYDTIKLKQDNSATQAEYLFETGLGSNVLARNSILFGKDIVVADTQDWNTSTFSWDSISADRPWLVEGANSSSVSYSIQISRDIGLAVDELYGYGLNSTTNEYTGTAASTSTGVTYDFSRLSKGLILDNGAANTTVEWTALTVPNVFSVSFNIKVIDLYDITYLTLRNSSSTNYLRIRYNNTSKEFILEDSNGVQTIVPYNITTNELLAVGIDQTSDTRTLYIGETIGKVIIPSISTTVVPIDTFDQLRLY